MKDQEAVAAWLRRTFPESGTPTLVIEGVILAAVLQRDPKRPFFSYAAGADSVLIRTTDTIVVEIAPRDHLRPTKDKPAGSLIGRVSFRGTAPFLLDWLPRFEFGFKFNGERVAFFFLVGTEWESFAVGDRVRSQGYLSGSFWSKHP